MKITMISASRANTYVECPMKYHRVYEDGLRSEADHLDFGTVMHSVLERLWREFAEPPGYDVAMEVFDQEFRAHPRLCAPEYYQQGISILESFLTNEENYRHRTLVRSDGSPYVEVEFFVDLEAPGRCYQTLDDATQAMKQGAKILRGYIDRIDSIDEARHVRVLDYKTSWVVKGRDELESDLQLAAYNLATRELLPGVERVDVCLNFLRSGVITYPIEKTSKQAEETRRYMLGLFGAIADDESPQERLNEYCPWCPGKASCASYRAALESSEIHDLSEAATLAERWALLKELKARRKALDAAVKELDGSISAAVRQSGRGAVSIGDGSELYLWQRRQVSYPPTAVAEIIGVDNLARVASVNNSKIRTCVKGDKAAAHALEQCAQVSYTAPSLRARNAQKQPQL
jgi:RecB family exonuclease